MSTSPLIASEESHPRSLRFWHWVNFLLVTALLLTVLVVKTSLNSKENTVLIKNVLSSKGVNVDDAQAKAVAKSLSKPVWELHTYLGYGLAALLLYRLIVEVRLVESQTLQYKIITKRKVLKEMLIPTIGAQHDFWVNIAYLIFYMILMVMVCSGLWLTLDMDSLKQVKKVVKQVHNISMYFMLAFYVVHILGVLLTELYKRNGLVSAMINGSQKHK